MLRAAVMHPTRNVVDLTGLWDFAFLGDVEPDELSVTDIQFDDRMAVPGAFDATPRYAGKRGLAAYRRTVSCQGEGRLRLVLDGLHHWGRVFANGRLLREHVGGFTEFHVDLPADVHGQVEVIILVDNRIDEKRCPLHLEYFDWYHFGGLTRSARMETLPGTWIDELSVITSDYRARSLEVMVAWRSAGAAGSETTLRIASDGRVVLEESVKLAGDSGALSRSITLEGAALWSPDDPQLHQLEVTLGDDRWVERIGIREVEVDGQRILINGKAVRLLGFNRHETHPQFGPGLPDALLVSDIQQLKDMGCNFVRGSHYPQDARFLDLCDEVGLCVWNETIGWQQTAAHLNDPAFLEGQLTQVDEMIRASINRPSVIMWGLLNESESHIAESRPGYEKLIGRIRQRDASRPVTYASNHPFDDRCLDLCDIISINTYPGWYGGEIEEIPGKLDEIAAHLDQHGCAEKPMIISEIGAGAIYGWRDIHGERWTEQYQEQLLETVIRHMFVDRDRYAGLAIWLFGDARTSRPKAIGRPRQFNNKGVVDEYRRPKLATALVTRLFHELG